MRDLTSIVIFNSIILIVRFENFRLGQRCDLGNGQHEKDKILFIIARNSIPFIQPWADK